MYQMNMMQQLNNCFFNTCCTIMTFIRYFNWYFNDSNVVPKNTGINLCDFHQLFKVMRLFNKYLVYSYIYVEIYPVTHLQLHNTFTSTSFTVIFSVRWYFPRYLVHSHVVLSPFPSLRYFRYFSFSLLESVSQVNHDYP